MTWSRSIKKALTMKNKLGFVNENLSETTNETKRIKWKRANDMVTSGIISSMSKEIAKTFVYSSSTRKLWIDFDEHFRESNGPQIYHIQ